MRVKAAITSAVITAGLLVSTAGMASADGGRKAPDYRRAPVLRRMDDVKKDRRANDLTVVPYANCTQMHKGYPNGIGREGATDLTRGHKKRHPDTKFFIFTASYNVNAKMDRDKDGVACETY